MRLVITVPAHTCAECGKKPEFYVQENLGAELVYYATKAVDEPWLCRNCRSKQ